VKIRPVLGTALALAAVALVLFVARASADVAPDPWSSTAADWARAVERSEAQLRATAARDSLGAEEREAALAQVRSGAASLRALLASAAAPDSVYGGQLIASLPQPKRRGQWGDRFIHATGVVAVSCGMVNMVMGMRDGDPDVRQTLGTVSGAVGGSGALFSMVRPRPKPGPWVDPNERMKAMVHEMLLREAFNETGRRLRELSDELGAMRPDSTTGQAASLEIAQRYAGALDRAGALFDVEVPHLSTLARQGGDNANFDPAARARLARGAERLDAVVAQWRSWRWLVGKSQRDALEYAAMVGRK
jgi:hypothetical protein